MTVSFTPDQSKETDRALYSLLIELNQNPFISGVTLKDIVVNASTPVTLGHSLGRVPSGYIILKKSAACDIYHTSLTASTIAIQGSSSATITIWVF